MSDTLSATVPNVAIGKNTPEKIASVLMITPQ